jgi:hypothetical protein
VLNGCLSITHVLSLNYMRVVFVPFMCCCTLILYLLSSPAFHILTLAATVKIANVVPLPACRHLW